MPTKHGASLVAPPDNKSNKPVAKGSRVPAWPVRARVRRRSAATIANDDGPAGLSARTIPTGLSARGGIGTTCVRSGERLAGGRPHERAVEELDDLRQLVLARESRGLPVASAAGATR